MANAGSAGTDRRPRLLRGAGDWRSEATVPNISREPRSRRIRKNADVSEQEVGWKPGKKEKAAKGRNLVIASAPANGKVPLAHHRVGAILACPQGPSYESCIYSPRT